MELPGGWAAWWPLLVLLTIRLIAHGCTRLAAMTYRPAPVTRLPLHGLDPVSAADLSVVTVLDGHDPAALARGLRSWTASGVGEVIVLAGVRDESCHRVLEEHPVRVIRRRGDLGHDVLAGVRAATGALVALVEPDTVWAPDAAEQLAAAFTADVAAVAVRRNAWPARTVLQRIGDLELDVQAFGAAAAGSRLERAVCGAWSGTAAFRRSAVCAAEAAMAQTPDGRLAAQTPAERLAELVIAAGGGAVLQRSARVWCVLPDRAAVLARSAVGRGRFGWPLLRAGVTAAVAHRQPYRAACLVAPWLAGPAALVVLGYQAAALLAGAWGLAATLATWIVFTRAVLLLPHLRRRPGALILVPLQVVTAGLGSILRLAGLLLATRPASADSDQGTQPSPAIDPALRLMPLRRPLQLTRIPLQEQAHPPNVTSQSQAADLAADLEADLEADLDVDLDVERTQRA